MESQFPMGIKELDNFVLSRIGKKPGDIVTAEEAFDLVNQAFRSFDDIKDVCGNCPWLEHCEWYKKRK